MKKFLILSSIFFFGLPIFYARPVFADNGSSTVQKVLENTKQFLDDLVTAKDENAGDDLELRIKTFGRVLDLSETEAKDLAFKLLAIDKDEKLEEWKKSALAKLDEAVSFIGSEKALISGNKLPDLATTKQIAQDFKQWRDENYLPLAGQIQDFLLIKQEARSIQIAQNRYSKITLDLRGLNRAKVSGSTEIKKLLDSSKANIIAASDLNNRAYGMFLKNYLDTALASSTTASSTVADGSDKLTGDQGDKSGPIKIQASSTNAITSSTATGPSTLPIVSTKELVKASLNKIKEAYQGFVDISNLVRRLLD